MKKLLAILLLVTISGCAVPFMVDSAAAQREADQKKIAEIDARLVQAYQQMEALAKSPATAETAAAAKTLADALKAMQAERAATQEHKDNLPKAHVDVDTLLSLGETGAGIAGLGWVAMLFKAGRKAKALADEYQEKHLSASADLENLKGNWKAAIAGIEDYAANLAPDAKRALYAALQAAAKLHAEDPIDMARMVAITKAEIRGSV